MNNQEKSNPNLDILSLGELTASQQSQELIKDRLPIARQSSPRMYLHR